MGDSITMDIMHSPHDEPAAGLPEQSLQNNNAHGRRWPKRGQRKRVKMPTPMFCAALFFSRVFSPLEGNCIIQNGTRSLSCSHNMQANQVTSVRVHAFSTPALITARTHNLRIGINQHQPLRVSASSTDTSVTSRQELEKMTVKQLKSYIVDKGIQIPKGQGSSLKLKKQIVDFIWNYQTAANGSEAEGVNGVKH